MKLEMFMEQTKRCLFTKFNLEYLINSYKETEEHVIEKRILNT